MSSSKAPPPDPAQQELARTQARNMDDQMAFSKQQYADQKAMADQQYQLGLRQQTFQEGLANDAKAQSDKYNALFDATTGKQIKNFSNAVDNFNTNDYRDQLAGSAMTDVRAGAEAATQQLNHNMALRGINPGSAASWAAQRDMASNMGANLSAAATMATRAAKDQGMQLMAQSAGLGSQLGGLSSSSLGQASGMGTSGLAASGAGLSASSTAGNNFNQGSNVATNWGSSANSTYNNLWQQAYQRSQSGGNGALGSLVGGLAGSFLGPMGSQIGSSLGKTIGAKMGGG